MLTPRSSQSAHNSEDRQTAPALDSDNGHLIGSDPRVRLRVRSLSSVTGCAISVSWSVGVERGYRPVYGGYVSSGPPGPKWHSSQPMARNDSRGTAMEEPIYIAPRLRQGLGRAIGARPFNRGLQTPS
jgi:hypothetical protein